MTYLDDLTREPWRYDFLAVMRRLERSLERSDPGRPRVGDGTTRADETLRVGGSDIGFRLGQNPSLTFPDATISEVHVKGNNLRILSHFLGYFGPQGALPLATTEEAYHFLRGRDDAFARFLDLFTNRFQQLFFRAWADARPAAQQDRPSRDRFTAYIGSTVGLGSQPFGDLDTIPDFGKLAFAGLLAPQAKSASRLRRAIAGLFEVRTDIEQFVGCWLPVEAAERTRLGQNNSRLGTETLLGASVFSVQDKITIVIFAPTMAQYDRFLPEGDQAGQPAGRYCQPLIDLVFFYVGDELDWNVELAIPSEQAPPVQLGRSGMLGWTSWMGRKAAPCGPSWRRDAHFRPAERARAKRDRIRAMAETPAAMSGRDRRS